MKHYDYFLLSYSAILRNKLRSFLSILGIVFGVATLVATISIAEGTKQTILKAVESLGTNLVVIVSNPKPGSLGLRLADVDVLKQFQATFKKITPLIIQPSIITYKNKTIPVSLIGTATDYPSIRKHPVQEGRFINQDDLVNFTKIAVLGPNAASNLLEYEKKIGQIIQIDKGTFLTVGIMEAKESSFLNAYRNTIFIPITTMQEVLGLGSNISQILIESNDSSTVYQTMREAKNILTNFHGGVSDFEIWCQEDLLTQKKRVTKIFKIALGSIAIISLLIGGIGIMNVMLASVNERIKEIGIRKALGASNHNIMFQFIYESLILSLLGGIIGIITGIFMGQKIATLLTALIPYEGPQWQAIATFDSIEIAFLFTLFTGFFFGLYPARRAAKLDPCEALTYE